MKTISPWTSLGLAVACFVLGTIGGPYAGAAFGVICFRFAVVVIEQAGERDP